MGRRPMPTNCKKKAVLYINSDGNGRGILNVGGSEDLEKFVSETLARRDRSGNQRSRWTRAAAPSCAWQARWRERS